MLRMEWWTAGFLLWVPAKYIKKNWMKSEKTTTQTGVDLFEKEGGYPEEWLHQSVFAQVVEGMDVIDRIIRENPSTPEEEITDIEIVSVNIEKYQESAQEQSEEGMELQTSADNQEAKPVLSYQSSGN